VPVVRLLDELWQAGHAAYVVGGSLRDALLDRRAADWDLTTDARPDRLLELFPDAVYENRFGTSSSVASVAYRSRVRIDDETLTIGGHRRVRRSDRAISPDATSP
jgi:tRNA nucleotidyltransferase/poly(A) polymerase